MKFTKSYQPIILGTFIVSLLASCASLDAEKLVKPTVNKEMNFAFASDPEPLKMSNSGQEAWQKLQGHYKVVSSKGQKPYFYITDIKVLERQGKPTVYMYDSSHNTYGFFQGSDCIPSGMNKGGDVDVMLYCTNSKSDMASFSIAELIKKPVLTDDSFDPFVGLIKTKERVLETKEATHIGHIKLFGYRSEGTIIFKKISDDTSLNLFNAK